MITSTKIYVSVVTLSINYNIKFLEKIKQGFKRTISWNKFRSEITTQTKINNLDYFIDPTFRNINRFFVVSFKNGNNDPTKDYFNKNYMPLVEIKDFNALIDNKPFFDQPVKNKQEVYDKLTEMSRNHIFNRKFIRLFVSSKLLQTYWYRFIQTNKYKYSSINKFYREIRRR